MLSFNVESQIFDHKMRRSQAEDGISEVQFFQKLSAPKNIINEVLKGSEILHRDKNLKVKVKSDLISN